MRVLFIVVGLIFATKLVTSYDPSVLSSHLARGFPPMSGPTVDLISPPSEAIEGLLHFGQGGDPEYFPCSIHSHQAERQIGH